MNTSDKIFFNDITWDPENSFYRKFSWEDIKPTRSNAEDSSWDAYSDFLMKFVNASSITFSYGGNWTANEQTLPESYPKGDINVLLGVD